MARVYVTRKLPGTALDRLAAEHEVSVWPERLPPRRPELFARVGESDGVLALLTDQLDAKLIEHAPSLKAISNYAVGVDNVDVGAASERGIPVGNTPGVLTDTTADLAVALMLAVSRKLLEGDAMVRGGEWLTWEPARPLGRDLHDATVGIVGFGRIGQAVAKRVEGFGCRVLHTGRSGGVPLAQLLERSDFVALHAPLTDDTRGLIGTEALAAMKPTAYLVNTARGPMVDSTALVRALHEGQIAGAALDVTDPEPLPAGHVLAEAPNTIILPHLGSASVATREAMADMAVNNLLAALRGERMPWCANPEVYGEGEG
jgi:glyoxylate reductase